MGRSPRHHLPGVAFHITARTQGRCHWFKESLRGAIEQHIRQGVTSSDATMLAYVVMPNHFHIILRQGNRPLGWIMQPIMRRIALLVQRVHRVGGHVFEGAFRSRPCSDADHLRRAIVYTHLNPLRATICDTAERYAWSSANAYDRAEDEPLCPAAIATTLKLFGRDENDSTKQLVRSYREYVEWRIAKDKHEADDKPYSVGEPLLPAGDLHFLRTFCAIRGDRPALSIDLRDKAQELLHRIDEQASIDDLRGRRGGRSGIYARRELIAALLQAGYAGRRIAQFFRVSDSLVSHIAMAARYAGSID